MAFPPSSVTDLQAGSTGTAPLIRLADTCLSFAEQLLRGFHVVLCHETTSDPNSNTCTGLGTATLAHVLQRTQVEHKTEG